MLAKTVALMDIFFSIFRHHKIHIPFKHAYSPLFLILFNASNTSQKYGKHH